jgi:TonB-linked SusC/RagA family outer membrane protein
MDRFLRTIKLACATILVGMLGALNLQAQSKTVSGVVRNDKEPLPGATVVEKGTINGTVTDVEGRFQLPVAEGATLVISFIGMKAQEVVVGNQTNFEVALETDVTMLSDVVVVGYSTVERRELTSSVSSVSAKQLADIPINSTAQALTGRLAGVQVVTSEGSPNATVQIRVRGGGSITQDNTPLFVVDGVQVENALSVLAPQDIQSIDVLKDASATAIYGARGANGVVIITTKGGKEMPTQVSINSLVGVRQVANSLDVMRPYDFVFYQYERSRGNASSEATFQKTYGNFSDLDLYKEVPFTDWQKESFGRNALMTTNNINVSGGTKDTQFGLSVTSNTEQGVQLGSDFDRKLVNFRFDQRISKYVKTGFNVRYNNTIVNGAGTSSAGSSSTNRLRQSIKYRPFLFPGQTTDTYDRSYALETNSNSLQLVNPVLLAQAEYQKDISSTANLNGYVLVEPTPYLSFRSTLGFDMFNQRVNVFNDTITNNAQQNGQGLPVASIANTQRTILNNNNVITFSLDKLKPAFGKNNKLDLLLGHEIYQTITKTLYNESHGFAAGTTAEIAINNMQLGTAYLNPGTPTSSEVTTRLLSFFGRVSYAYMDKYLAVLTYRADGSSKFADGKKWGYFPSVSLGWRISQEPFFAPLRSKVNDLKIRLSGGQAGNNRINDFLYLPQFEVYPPYDLNNNQVIGFGPKRDGGVPVPSNANLKWETTTSRNIGFDASFLENRIQLSVDYYRNTTSDLLIATPIPTSSGYQTQLQNVGSTSNRGVEIQLSGTPILKNAFSWKAAFNMSFNKNNIETLGRQSSFLFNSGWANNSPFDYSVAVGQPTGTIWGLVNDGYYKIEDFDYNSSTGVYTLKPEVPSDVKVTSLTPKPGVIKYKDINGDGVVDDLDRTSIGNANPTFFGGFNNQFTYKNFDLSVFINFQYGNKVLNANKLEFTSGYTTNSNMLSIMNQRWRNVDNEGNVVTDPATLGALNANATIWSPLTSAASFYVNSWSVEDASFIRINNVTLGYSLPSTILQKVKIVKLRFYATANNLAVFTNYSGYDPDVNTRRATPITPGVDYSAYPRSHAYIFGVNMTF